MKEQILNLIDVAIRRIYQSKGRTWQIELEELKRKVSRLADVDSIVGFESTLLETEKEELNAS
jgi:hypothetical protein